MRLRFGFCLAVLILVMSSVFPAFADEFASPSPTPTPSSEQQETAQPVPLPQPAEVVTEEPVPIEAAAEPVVETPAPAVETPQPAPAPAAVPGLPQPNIFADHFFLKPELKLKNKTWEYQGFVFAETPDPETKTRYSIVTDFGGNALKSRSLAGLEKVEDVRKWVKENLKSAVFEGIEVKRLPLSTTPGEEKFGYWVGQKSFETSDQARGEIAMIKAVAEKQGRDFNAMMIEASKYIAPPEEEPPVQITPAQFEKEEQIMLKFLDQLDIGNEILGPLQGEGAGEPIIWQSFGETSWRMTNLADRNFSDQVGFYTNRIVIKGIRAPLNTIDPFVEATAALETNGVDSASKLDLSAGVEWRPFARNPWFLNFRPWTLPLLEFVRNYRFYVQYFDRKNLKDEIPDVVDWDINAGVQIYYEWGVDLPTASEGAPDTVPDYIRHYIWGEYFGNYRFEKTNFFKKNFDGFIFNSSVLLGFIMPGIPLPPNPITDEFVLMPYFHLEHVDNAHHSFFYQNRWFVGAGARWMPFRNYRYKENEWLSKTKVFIEYVGVGDAWYYKQEGDPGVPRYDFRIGVSVSQRRF